MKEDGDEEEDDWIDVAPEWSQKIKKENEEAGLVKRVGSVAKIDDASCCGFCVCFVKFSQWAENAGPLVMNITSQWDH